MNRDPLLAKIKPLADKLAADIVARLLQEHDDARARAITIAREALQLEFDQEDGDASDQAVEGSPVRTPRSARRKAPAARVPRDGGAENHRPRRSRAVARRPDGDGNGAGAPAPARPPRACAVCGEAGHNARRHKSDPPRANLATEIGGGACSAIVRGGPENTASPSTKRDRFAVIEAAAASRRAGVVA